MQVFKAEIRKMKQRKPNSEERGPDDMQETANHLVRIAIQALMRMRDVDWQTATHWIHRAAAATKNDKLPRASG
jgi:hypothetical protein